MNEIRFRAVLYGDAYDVVDITIAQGGGVTFVTLYDLSAEAMIKAPVPIDNLDALVVYTDTKDLRGTDLLARK